MKLSQVVNSGKRFRRSSWENDAFYMMVHNGDILTYDEDSTQEVPNGSVAELDVEDILAYDWELEAETQEDTTKLEIIDYDDDYITFTKSDGDPIGTFHVVSPDLGALVTENDTDKILDFIYNNTEIGKKRIIPF